MTEVDTILFSKASTVRFSVDHIPDGAVGNSVPFGKGFVALPTRECSQDGNFVGVGEFGFCPVSLLKAIWTEACRRFWLAVLPGFPRKDQSNCYSTDSEFLCNCAACQSGLVKVMDKWNVYLFDFGAPLDFSFRLSAVRNSVFGILFGGPPAEVFQTVVPGLSVDVSALKSTWAGSDECLKDQLVNSPRSSLSVLTYLYEEVAKVVSLGFENLSSNSSESVPLTDFPSDGPYSSQVRDFVHAFVINHRFPCFGHFQSSLSYGNHPHAFHDYTESRLAWEGGLGCS